MAGLQGGVSFDMTKMDQVVEVNAEDFDCTVQPGVTRVDLNTYLRDTGLWFPIGIDLNLPSGPHRYSVKLSLWSP